MSQPLAVVIPDRHVDTVEPVDVLRRRLDRLPGLQHIQTAAGHATPLTLHLTCDPRRLSLADLHAAVLGPGRNGEADPQDEAPIEIILPVRGMVSPRQEAQVESAMRRLSGRPARASFARSELRLAVDRVPLSLVDVQRQLAELGMRLASPGETAAPVPPSPLRRVGRLARDYPQLSTASVGGVLLAIGTAVYLAAGPEPLRLALVGLAYLLCGWRIAQASAEALWQRRLDIDVLMFTAAVGAAVLGHYEEGALLLLLFALGESGEQLAIGRARRAIQALTKLAPQTAIRLETTPGEGDQLVPVEELAVGDRIRIGADQQVPADAVVVAGESTVDQSPITGESVPVDKAEGDALFAGTFNGGGALIAEVTKLARDNTLSKVIRLVEQAQSAKSPTQQLAERFERWYVPCVLGATVLLMLVPPLLGITPRRHDGALWAGWFYQALAFLTAASPCALAIGTPAAILAGIGKAARLGVLVKGGVHLENLAGVRAVAFDKTGTLTAGKPRLVAMQSFDEQWPADTLLRMVGSLELGSSHPLARAIVDACKARDLTLRDPETVERTMAAGMRGRVEGHAVAVGRRLLFGDDLDAAVQTTWDDWQQQGRTTIGVAVDERVVGLIALMDEPRPAAADTIAALHRMGLRETVMLTGDHHAAARTIADRLGITRVEAGLLPQQKLDRVRELDRTYGGVAMVGDGVNDAPALAAATVGLAIGGAGSANDVALETADVVLLADDLHKLPEAISLARFTRRIIRENLVIAFGVIALLAPMGALGVAPISLAVLFHEGSTVLVVLNGLRILRHRGLSESRAARHADAVRRGV